MPETSAMQTPQSPARPATAEEAQLDARLELAAKKAALRSLEAQAGGPPAAEAPAPPAGRVVITSGDKSIVIENPTPEQLAQLGAATAPSQAPTLEGWALVSLSGMVVGTIIVVTALILKHIRTRSSAQHTATDAKAEARMARIENAIESVAVEVERISEGQRFAARMLAEGAAVPERGEAIPQQRMERQP
jgi:hypothetical protein